VAGIRGVSIRGFGSRVVASIDMNQGWDTGSTDLECILEEFKNIRITKAGAEECKDQKSRDKECTGSKLCVMGVLRS
jgi:hypothetical protein